MSIFNGNKNYNGYNSIKSMNSAAETHRATWTVPDRSSLALPHHCKTFGNSPVVMSSFINKIVNDQPHMVILKKLSKNYCWFKNILSPKYSDKTLILELCLTELLPKSMNFNIEEQEMFFIEVEIISTNNRSNMCKTKFIFSSLKQKQIIQNIYEAIKASQADQSLIIAA